MPPESAPTDAPTLVFSHGNGFPAGTYRRLFEAWRAAGFRVEALEKFGHDQRFPVTDNWPNLRDELIHFIEARGHGPVWLVGHSLGGLLSLLAASKRPDLARGLVLLDSPIVTGWRAQSVRVIKAAGLIGRLPPARASQRRRHEWPSKGAVRTHFVAKPMFAAWHPDVLDDYVESGFESGSGGLTRLGFRRDVETTIYRTLPHDLGALLRRHPPKCPLAFIAGTRSEEMRRGGTAAVRALAGDRLAWIEGSHLYPMERPDETAARVVELIARMAAG